MLCAPEASACEIDMSHVLLSFEWASDPDGVPVVVVYMSEQAYCVAQRPSGRDFAFGICVYRICSMEVECDRLECLYGLDV